MCLVQNSVPIQKQNPTFVGFFEPTESSLLVSTELYHLLLKGDLKLHGFSSLNSFTGSWISWKQLQEEQKLKLH